MPRRIRSTRIRLCIVAATALTLNACAVSQNRQAPLQGAEGDSTPPLTQSYTSVAQHSTEVRRSAMYDFSSTDLDQSSDEPETLDEQSDSADADDLWEHMRAGFSLERPDDSRELQAEINWYARHPRFLERVSARANPYLHFVVERVEEKGFPLEIALLPVVESGFQPEARSPSDAAGLWQFIPGTGAHFGLKQNGWYDGRRDIYASTRAALDYLGQLNEQFDGDWLLALAAYNAGAGTVSRAIEKNQRNGRPTDFWSLDLPPQTREYVPKLLAITAIVADPVAFDVELEPVPNRRYLQRVKLNEPLDLDVAARLAGISLDEVKQLNPGFKTGTMAPNGPFHLLLPADKVDRFQTRLAELPGEERRSPTLARAASAHSPAKRTQVATAKPVAKQAKRTADEILRHTVAAGDTLWGIARKYGVSTVELTSWNRLDKRSSLQPGQRLQVSAAGSATKAGAASEAKLAAASQAGRSRAIRYTVRRGDSLWQISQRFRVTVSDLRQWNNIDGSADLQPGQRLRVYLDNSGQT